MDDLKPHEILFLEELERGPGGALDVLQRCKLPGSADRANAIAKRLRGSNFVITAFSEPGEQGMHVELSPDGRGYLEERRLEVEPIPTSANADPHDTLNIEQNVEPIVVPGAMSEGQEIILLQWLKGQGGEGGAYTPFAHSGGGGVAKSNRLVDALVRKGWIVGATPPENATHHGKYVKITEAGLAAHQRHWDQMAEQLRAHNAQKKIDKQRFFYKRAIKTPERREREEAKHQIAAGEEEVGWALETLDRLDPAKAAEARRLFAEDARHLAEKEAQDAQDAKVLAARRRAEGGDLSPEQLQLLRGLRQKGGEDFAVSALKAMGPYDGGVAGPVSGAEVIVNELEKRKFVVVPNPRTTNSVFGVKVRLSDKGFNVLRELDPPNTAYSQPLWTPEEIAESQRLAQARVDQLRPLNEAAARRDGAAVLKGQDRIDVRKGTNAKGEEPVYHVRIVNEKRGLGWKAWTAIAALGTFIFLTAVAFVVEAVKPEAIDAIRARLPWVQKESPASPALPADPQSGSPGSPNDPDVPTLPHDSKEAPDVKTLPAPSGAAVAPTTQP